jgi:hypothetical protein
MAALTGIAITGTIVAWALWRLSRKPPIIILGAGAATGSS